jgi:hypothetical protein
MFDRDSSLSNLRGQWRYTPVKQPDGCGGQLRLAAQPLGPQTVDASCGLLW